MAAPYRTVTHQAPKEAPAGVDGSAALLGLDRHAFFAVLRDLLRSLRGEVKRVAVSDRIPEVRLRGPHETPRGWTGPAGART